MRLTRLVCLVLLCTVAAAQDLSTRPAGVTSKGAPKLPNSNSVYQALRSVTLGQEAFSVNGLVLQRESTRFTFTSGTLCMLAPINGKVTGAVFVGKGSFSLVPPSQAPTEVRQIALLTREGKVDEEFSELVLRFTDNTYDEVKKATGATLTPGATCPVAALEDFNKRFRKDLNSNIHGRILQDVLSDQPGGLFLALIEGKKYSSRMLFMVDPHPFGTFVPEEVMLMTFNDNKWGIWASYHMASCYSANQGGSAEKNSFWYPDRHSIDTTLEKNAKLIGKSTTTIVSNVDGLSVVPLNLFSTLRVDSVTSEKGEPLDFIQEKKEEDSDYFVILPTSLKKGEKLSFTSTYSGKEAVTNEGDGNYYPVTRSAWYPNHDFGTYTKYDLTFRVPKNMKMVATGDLVREITEGNQNISEWKAETPIAVAGFNFGKFKIKEGTLEKSGYKVQALANEYKSDQIAYLQQLQDASEGGLGAIGTMSTTATLDRALSEAQASVFLYHDYFGPMSYKSVAVTQQSAWGYGQAWPGLIFLPTDYFFDATTRHQLLGFDPHGYYKVVAPHEVAHQWWGHTVGFNSYRDQWMSEGFSDFSASLFIQLIRKDMGEYRKFWKDQRESIVQKNSFGIRAIDVGPLTMGRRLSTTKTSNVYYDLIYPKGSYVLHMLRWMMWDNKTGDQKFKAMMQDFVNTYRNQPATTEHFKAAVEKHMLPNMNLDGNGKMDWFFNEWVYGTALPKYTLEQSIGTVADGGTVVKFKVTQSGVDQNFKMIVPLYLELSDGRIIRLGSGGIVGNNFIESTVPLGKMASPPKRALVNYYYDILSDD